MQSSQKKRLELKGELSRRGLSYRDLSRLLEGRGFDAGEFLISRIISGRVYPSEELRGAIAEILGRPSFELFGRGGDS